MAKIVTGGLILTLALAVPVVKAAEEPELLKETKRLKEVAAQRVEAEVREALTEAARLQRTQPAKASAVLREALQVVENDNVLSAERRQFLRNRLKGALNALDVDTAAQAA